MNDHRNDATELDFIIERLEQHTQTTAEALAPYVTMGVDAPAELMDKIIAEAASLRADVAAACDRASHPKLKEQYTALVKDLDDSLATLKSND